MSSLHDRNLAGFAWLTQAEITNKGLVSEGIYYLNGSVLAFLRKPLPSCCAHECYRGTCWDCSGKNCNKSCSKSIDVYMCDVLLQHKSGHIRHLHQKHGSLTFHLTESFQGGSLFNRPCDWRVSSRVCGSLWMSMPSTALQLPIRRLFWKRMRSLGAMLNIFKVISHCF